MAPQHNPFVLSGFPDARYSLAYPLHAATVGLADTAFKQALLAPDCNALRRDGLGNTPLMLLLYRVAHQANNTLPLATVLDRMNELLKKAPLAKELPNQKQKYPLHVAVESGCKDAVQGLLALGVNVNAKDDDASTPLHLALASKHFAIGQVLVKYQANTKAKNFHKQTPESLVESMTGPQQEQARAVLAGTYGPSVPSAGQQPQISTARAAPSGDGIRTSQGKPAAPIVSLATVSSKPAAAPASKPKASPIMMMTLPPEGPSSASSGISPSVKAPASAAAQTAPAAIPTTMATDWYTEDAAFRSVMRAFHSKLAPTSIQYVRNTGEFECTYPQGVVRFTQDFRRSWSVTAKTPADAAWRHSMMTLIGTLPGMTQNSPPTSLTAPSPEGPSVPQALPPPPPLPDDSSGPAVPGCPFCRAVVKSINQLCYACGCKPDAADPKPDLSAAVSAANMDIIGELGAGSFGVVWKATWRTGLEGIDGEKTVAIKKVPQVAASKAEYEALRRAAHANVVELFGAYSMTEDRVQYSFLVMEFAVRGSLYDEICRWADVTVPAARKLRVAVDVLSGLAFLHSRTVPIIHRDVKTRNILMFADGTAKLSDFGSAVEAKTNAAKTEARIVGTWAYLAPECLSRKPSRSSDIWATGMVLYELFTQNCEPWSHTEFEPKSSNAVQEFLDHVKVNADRPRFSNDWVEQNTCHREVHMAILHCWELQPDKRPSASHALELFDVLLQKELIPN